MVKHRSIDPNYHRLVVEGRRQELRLQSCNNNLNMEQKFQNIKQTLILILCGKDFSCDYTSLFLFILSMHEEQDRAFINIVSYNL